MLMDSLRQPARTATTKSVGKPSVTSGIRIDRRAKIRLQGHIRRRTSHYQRIGQTLLRLGIERNRTDYKNGLYGKLGLWCPVLAQIRILQDELGIEEPQLLLIARRVSGDGRLLSVDHLMSVDQLELLQDLQRIAAQEAELAGV